ncbi:MAG: benzoate-CoA ligase family protein [Acidimicrobiales bacterium]
MSERFNATEYLLDRRLEAGDGERLAVVHQGSRLSYRDLAGLTSTVAGGLLALGLRREERVMLAMLDGPELLAGILAAMRIGAVAVPVSTMLTGVELGSVLADSGARLLAVSPELSAQAWAAAAMAPELAYLVGAVAAPEAGAGAGSPPEDGRVRTLSWEDLMAAGGGARSGGGPGDLLAPAATGEDSPALWLYTSGTTGTAKGAMHRHANLRHVCETYAAQVLGIERDDLCYSVAKLFFAYGLGNSALFPLSVGAATVLDPARPTPAGVAEALVRERPTLFFGVPTFYAALLAAQLPPETFAPVRRCASAGEALPAQLYDRFAERFGVEILDGLGSTEMLHIFLSNRPGRVRPGTTGVPVPGYDLELRAPDGQAVATGAPGTLYVRGQSMATGYWCRTEATRAVFQGEWLCTGDTYVASDDGYYTCLGRTDDLLKAGGIWVSPAEVEARLAAHPSVAEVAVVGLPDADGLGKPVACVVAAPGAEVDPDELVAWCRAGLAAFKRPRSVVVVAELPKTATGKVRRFKIREMLAAPAGQSAPVAAGPRPGPRSGGSGEARERAADVGATSAI